MAVVNGKKVEREYKTCKKILELDFNDFSNNFNTLDDVIAFSLPKGARVLGVSMDIQTSFASLGAVTLSVTDGAGTDWFINEDLKAAPGAQKSHKVAYYENAGDTLKVVPTYPNAVTAGKVVLVFEYHKVRSEEYNVDLS